MSTGYTSLAQEVIDEARNQAVIHKHNYVGTEHVLLALTLSGGLAGGVLQALGITYDKMQSRVVRITGIGEEIHRDPIPYTPRVDRILLSYAEIEALSRGENEIKSEHILLGLVREEEGVAMRILNDHEVYGDDVRRKVDEMLVTAGSAS